METVYQIRFTHATPVQNFSISMESFDEFPVSTMFNSSHLDINLFAFTSNEHARDTDFLSNYHNKFRLIVKLFIDYRLNLESFKPNGVQNIDLSERYPKISIINFDDSNYMNSNLDSTQKDLLEHLDDLAQGRLKTAIPNIVNWMDAYVGKNSSGFCVLRNAYQHPDLWEDTKKELEKKFNGKAVFNSNGSIDRDAEENLEILKSCIVPILTEIKNAFRGKYFDSEKLPHKILLNVT